MTVRPTEAKIILLKKKIESLLEGPPRSIRAAASILGLMNDMCKAVDYGLGHVKSLEMDKIRSLKVSGSAQFDGRFFLSAKGRNDLDWWSANVDWRCRAIRVKAPSFSIFTDASNLGWGAVFDNKCSGGRWSLLEAEFHINVLELMAVELGLQTFCKELKGVSIRVVSDNTTTVAYINHMGGTKSKQCNEVAHRIWVWCEAREIWLRATHLPGVENVEADHESRNFTENTEWKLNPKLFAQICDKFGLPDVDLFASRLTCQVPTYCSWIPDPGATFVDAFSFDWHQFNLAYAFPPFSLLNKTLQKIRAEEASVILVIPRWRAQPWWSTARNLARDLLEIPTSPGNLLQCSKKTQKADLTDLALVALLC